MSTHQESGIRTRRALNNLQFSPNGKETTTLTTSSAKVKSKKGLNERKFSNNVRNNSNNGLTKRTSISLPDICGTNKALKSVNSTPNKNQRIEPFIKEEKENPNLLIEKKQASKTLFKEKQNKNRENLSKSKEISIQCNKSDEDMLLSSSVEGTPYWKLLAHKRLRCLLETQKENDQLNESIADLDKINDDLRERNNQLHEVLKEYNEIKNQILECIEEGDEDDEEVNDSGLI